MIGHRKNFRTYTVALTANQEFPLAVQGNMYAVISNTGDFTITLDESNKLISQTAGMGGKFDDVYNRVTLLSSTTQSVTVIFGYGSFVDARASVNATINTTVAPSDTLDNSSDITVTSAATLLKAADTNTKEVLIHVPADALNSIRVGAGSVTATSGIEIEPGTTLSMACEAAVYAIRDGSSDVVVSTLKLTRV
jgi:hypothetical protein